MGAHGGKTVMPGHSGIGIERGEQFESFSGSMHHGSGNGIIQHHHGIVRHSPQQVIERQDLRPIGVFGPGSLVMNGGDRGLKLIRADGSFRQGRGEKRDAF